ncbi:hypothetical protein CARUB_v10025188mg [Capsella rubella]|uniref:TTF-type domain-containing protein n=1 Tax=Capsella rubella TaxID=81985 RepID=R0HXZ8_9BRAS|nr:hypothetical protein CARUB_v10025188mg [Capsella rubella]
MKKFYKPIPKPTSHPNVDDQPLDPANTNVDNQPLDPANINVDDQPLDPDNTNVDDLPWDPAKRKEIVSYHPNRRDEVRRKYLVRGPCQPSGHSFKRTKMSNATRRFNPAWFEKYGDGRKQGESDAFVKEGFCLWNKPERLETHIGGTNSFHNCAVEKCDNLMKQAQSIKHSLFKQNDVVKNEYHIRVTASIDATLVNVVGASCKRQDLIRETYRKRCRKELVVYFHTFDCVFYMQLMLLILGLTENLSMALQRKDQDILNAMSLVEPTKRELQKLRDDGWDSLMKKHNAELLVMEDVFVDPRKPRRKTNITNLHHYKVNCFYTIIDLHLQEFNDRFTEVTTRLLICLASLSPLDSFQEFNREKLVRLAKFYPDDFSYGEVLSLEQHLDIYIDNVSRDERFKCLKSLGELSRLMVKTQKHLAQCLVYRLLKLVLTLPVATASVERYFSAMKLVKTTARNRIGDQFPTVTNENMIKRFPLLNERRVVL